MSVNLINRNTDDQSSPAICFLNFIFKQPFLGVIAKGFCLLLHPIGLRAFLL